MNEKMKLAKMGALSGLRDEMKGLLAGEVKGLKKVTVAAPDKKSLKAGLDKAEEMVSEQPEDEFCPECASKHAAGAHTTEAEESEEAPETEESSEEEKKDPSEMSAEELSAYIQELEALKKSKMMG